MTKPLTMPKSYKERIFYDPRFQVGVVLSVSEKKGNSLRLFHTECMRGLLVANKSTSVPRCGGCGADFSERTGFTTELPLDNKVVTDDLVEYWLSIWFDVTSRDVTVTIT